MGLLVFSKDVVLLSSSCVVLCSVDIWNVSFNIILVFWLPVVSFDYIHPLLLFWMSYVYWLMVFLKYLLFDFLAVWYTDSSIYINDSIFFPCLSIFLFQFLAYFLFFHFIPLYLFQYSGFFYHLVSSYHLYLCCYLSFCPHFILEHLYIFVVFCDVNVIFSW